MTAHAPVLIGIKRRISSTRASAHHPAENIRYLRPNRWLVAIDRLSVCQGMDGEGKIELFRTSPRTPLELPLEDECAFRNEVELRRSLLPPGEYTAIETELLWFATHVTVVDWEVTGGKPATLQMKIVTSSTPSLGTRRGDLLLTFGGKDYWLSPDWKSLSPNRPQAPLSAILISDQARFSSVHRQPISSQLLPGERFRIRLKLSSPVVIKDNAGNNHRRNIRLASG